MNLQPQRTQRSQRVPFIAAAFPSKQTVESEMQLQDFPARSPLSHCVRYSIPAGCVCCPVKFMNTGGPIPVHVSALLAMLCSLRSLRLKEP